MAQSFDQILQNSNSFCEMKKNLGGTFLNKWSEVTYLQQKFGYVHRRDADLLLRILAI